MINRTRYANHVIDWDENIAQAFSPIFHKHKLILVIGPMGAGKTHFIKSVREGPLYTKGYWSSQIILDNVFPSMDNFETSLWNSIRSVESIIIPQALNTERHQMFVEGWYRMPSQRSKIRSYSPASTICVVVDGPTDAIALRASQAAYNGFYAIEELAVKIADQKATFQWPTKNEKFDQIIYVNTFGEEGRQYLRQTTYEG